MAFEKTRARLSELKNKVISHSKANIEKYKERKKIEHEENEKYKQEEREAYRSELHRARVKNMKVKAREKAKGGIMGFSNLLSSNRIELGPSNKVIGETQNIWGDNKSRGVGKNIITGEVIGMKRHKHNKHNKHNKEKTIHIHL
jgi:hypothetical protein